MDELNKTKEDVAISIGNIGKQLKKSRIKVERFSEAIEDGYSFATLRLYKKRGEDGELPPCVTFKIGFKELMSLQEFFIAENEKMQQEFDELYELEN